MKPKPLYVASKHTAVLNALTPEDRARIDRVKRLAMAGEHARILREMHADVATIEAKLYPGEK